MMKNFGKTEQSLPNFKLPEIVEKEKTTKFFEMPNDFNIKEYQTLVGGEMQKSSGGVIRTKGRWSGKGTYTAKKSLGHIYRSNQWKI